MGQGFWELPAILFVCLYAHVTLLVPPCYGRALSCVPGMVLYPHLLCWQLRDFSVPMKQEVLFFPLGNVLQDTTDDHVEGLNMEAIMDSGFSLAALNLGPCPDQHSRIPPACHPGCSSQGLDRAHLSPPSMPEMPLSPYELSGWLITPEQPLPLL